MTPQQVIGWAFAALVVVGVFVFLFALLDRV